MKRTILALLIISIVGIALAQDEPTPLPGPVYDQYYQEWLQTREQVLADCATGELPAFICETVITPEEWRAQHVPIRNTSPPERSVVEVSPVTPVMQPAEIIEINETYTDEFWSWLPE